MRNFDLTKSIEVLERTPNVLSSLLLGLSDDWVSIDEGPDTWSPYDVVGHLIHGEKTDWIPRMDIVLSDATEKDFKPFDRFAQFSESKGKTLKVLLEVFKLLRKSNIDRLRSRDFSESDFTRMGVHPEFGKVTLSQLLATWVVHDLNHIAQITRIMANQYRSDVGPWKAYLKILSI